MSLASTNYRKMDWLDPARVMRVRNVIAINAGRMRDEPHRWRGGR